MALAVTTHGVMPPLPMSRRVARRHLEALSPSSPSRSVSPESRGSPEPSDEELFDAHMAGNPDAFKRLFFRHGPRMYSVMRQRGLDDDDAQDLVQQTFVAVHQARADFRKGDKLRPWLWTIAFNLIRATWRRRARSVKQTERLGPARATSDHPIDESEHAVRQAIALLAAAQQEVVVLHWYEGLSFAEIGRVLHLTEAAVKGRAHRAYERLRGLLAEPKEREGGD